MSRRLVLASLLTLAVAACVEPEPGPVYPVDPLPEDACQASGLQGLVGQSATVLQTMKFGVPTRVIEPGMAVTMDFQPGRLNIWIADGGVIERVTCG